MQCGAVVRARGGKNPRWIPRLSRSQDPAASPPETQKHMSTHSTAHMWSQQQPKRGNSPKPFTGWMNARGRPGNRGLPGTDARRHAQGPPKCWAEERSHVGLTPQTGCRDGGGRRAHRDFHSGRPWCHTYKMQGQKVSHRFYSHHAFLDRQARSVPPTRQWVDTREHWKHGRSPGASPLVCSTWRSKTQSQEKDPKRFSGLRCCWAARGNNDTGLNGVLLAVILPASLPLLGAAVRKF